ncbi:MAG: aminotransferase class I/II-fold pyridoxal phosphate-dependent enzyme [Thermoanaerobaculia bacterium]
MSDRGSIKPYRRNRPPQPIDLWLDGNEGAAPPHDLLVRLAGSADGNLLSRYPNASTLESALAARFGVPAESVLVTAGADEALDRICRAFLGPGLRALTTVPTFAMLPRYVDLAGAALDAVEWWDGPFPQSALRRAVAERRPAVVFLTSPVNPTGRPVPTAALRALAGADCAAVLVADLAYVEFADEDPTAELLASPGALVVRTLSKAWGLAGLRVGYVLGSPERIESLRAAGGPYSVAAFSLTLAAAWLHEGESAVATAVARVREERRELACRLRGAGLEVPESQASFVLARGRSAAWLGDALAGLGIAVRRIDDPSGPGAVRLTCPGGEAQHRLLAGLDAALEPQALLLDLDGVIADVRESYDRAILATAAQRGVTATLEDVDRVRNAGHANDDLEVTRRLLAASGVQVSAEETEQRFTGLLEQGLWRYERPRVSPQRLTEWARRMLLGVVTGRPRREALRFLERCGLAPAVSALVCREDAPLKPDPAPVRQALAALRVERAWMVGDTPDDMTAARGAGVVPIGVVPPGADRVACERALLSAGAARVLGHPEDLEELLP